MSCFSGGRPRSPSLNVSHILPLRDRINERQYSAADRVRQIRHRLDDTDQVGVDFGMTGQGLGQGPPGTWIRLAFAELAGDNRHAGTVIGSRRSEGRRWLRPCPAAPSGTGRLRGGVARTWVLLSGGRNAGRMGRINEPISGSNAARISASLAVCKRRSRSAALAEVRSADPEV